jgi:hypothetical protein
MGRDSDTRLASSANRTGAIVIRGSRRAGALARLLAVLTAITVAAVVLTGCNGQTEPPSASGGPTTAPMDSPPPTAAASLGVVWNCRQGATRPHRVVLACGDGGLFLSQLTWRSWANTGAVATGRLHAVLQSGNDAGNSTLKARVTFKRPKPTSDYPWLVTDGSTDRVFTQVVIKTMRTTPQWPHRVEVRSAV